MDTSSKKIEFILSLIIFYLIISIMIKRTQTKEIKQYFKCIYSNQRQISLQYFDLNYELKNF